MNYLGMKISVVGPVKVTISEIVKTKSKVGPRRTRKQKVKVFVRWQEVLEDWQVIKFEQANALQMNEKTYAHLRKAIEAEQKKALGIPSELLGPAMRGAY